MYRSKLSQAEAKASELEKRMKFSSSNLDPIQEKESFESTRNMELNSGNEYDSDEEDPIMIQKRVPKVPF